MIGIGAGMILGILITVFFLVIIKPKKGKSLSKAVSNPIVEANYNGGIMTIEYYNGKIKKYSGSVTVWHTYPMMNRCGTFKEGELCDIYTYIKKHGNPYPTAHQKSENNHNDFHG